MNATTFYKENKNITRASLHQIKNVATNQKALVAFVPGPSDIPH